MTYVRLHTVIERLNANPIAWTGIAVLLVPLCWFGVIVLTSIKP